MHPKGATLAGRYALQLSCQVKNDQGEARKITGWLGEKRVNGKDFAFFVPENESLMLEHIEYINQNHYRIPGAPETEHCKQCLYLSIVADDNKGKVGFSGCWGAASWNLEQFTPTRFTGKNVDEKELDYKEYQAEQRDEKRKAGDNFVLIPTGQRLSLDKGDTGKPLVCLSDPPKFVGPEDPNANKRDKLDDSVLTVKLVRRAT